MFVGHVDKNFILNNKMENSNKLTYKLRKVMDVDCMQRPSLLDVRGYPVGIEVVTFFLLKS